MPAYEPPAPFSPQAIAAYGAATVRPPAVGRGGGDGDYMQAWLASANNAARMSTAAAERDQQAALFRLQADQRAHEFGLSRQLSPRDAAGMAHENQQLQMRFQQQLALQQTELTQAENLRLQRLKTARAHVHEQAAAGTLSPEEANAALMQIETGINPLEMRKAKAEMEQTAAREKLIQSQAAKQIAMMEENAKFRAKSVKDRFVQHTLANGATVDLVEVEPGVFKQLEPPKEPAAPKLPKAPVWDPVKADTAAEREAKLRFPDDEVNPHTGQTYPSAAILAKRNEAKTEIWNNMRREKKDEIAAYETKYGLRPPAGAGAGGTGAEDKGPAKPAVEFKPFKRDDPSTMNDVQQFMVGKFRQMGAQIEGRTDLDPQLQGQALVATYRAEELLAEWGSVEKMPADKKQEYERLERFLKSIPPKPAPAAAAAPPPPPPPPPAAIPAVAAANPQGPPGSFAKFTTGKLVTKDDLLRWADKFDRGTLITTDDIANLFR